MTTTRNVAGVAPPVVLLHGLGANARLNWDAAAPTLRDHFPVVAPDLRGHGRAAARTGRFSLEDAADDVAELLDRLSLGPAIVVGYSMGGAIAQLVWRRHRDLVRGLVLCATSRSFRGTFSEHLLFGALPAARLVANAIGAAITHSTVHFLAERSSVASRVRDRKQLVTFDTKQVLDAADALGRFRSHEWVGTIDVPTAVLVHLRDQLVPPRRQFALARAVPGSVLHAVDGDHFAAVDHPAFAPTLLRAVRAVTAAHDGTSTVASTSVARQWTCAA
jgi:pimeloyl-ACP methyl ester carboxylesterase